MSNAPKGYQALRYFWADEPIVSMLVFEGVLMVATSRRVFRFKAKTQDFREVVFIGRDATARADQ